MDLKKIIQITVLVGFIASVISGVVSFGLAYDKTVAKLERVLLVEKRLEQKIVDDEKKQVQRDIYNIVDRYGKDPGKMTQDVKDRYRQLTEDLKDAIQKLQDLRKKDG